ncbi:MAG TPA: hypothetical protein VFO71_02675 [Gemmatimonadales bacterium]|nr:hypothetical protein [Gemmatimonadales bacterium]
MPIISGPVGTLLVALAALIALVLWLRRPRRYPGPRIEGEKGIDYEELEAAEREVRDLDPNARPEDGFLGDDWGPGASRPRPPERL